MSDEISGLDHRFGLRDKKIEALEKQIVDINKTIDNRDIIPKGWAKSIDGYSKLKKQIAELKEQIRGMDRTVGSVVNHLIDRLDNQEKVLRELHELMRGLVSDLQESNSLSKATIKCYEGKLIKNLEKLDSDPVQNRIDRLDAGLKILKKHEEALKDVIPIKAEKRKKVYRMQLFPPDATPFDIYQIGKKKANKDLIKEFVKIGDRIVKQIGAKYGSDAKGTEFLENLFKDEIKKLEAKLKE